jgi:hypothetical protein
VAERGLALLDEAGVDGRVGDIARDGQDHRSSDGVTDWGFATSALPSLRFAIISATPGPKRVAGGRRRSCKV